MSRPDYHTSSCCHAMAVLAFYSLDEKAKRQEIRWRCSKCEKDCTTEIKQGHIKV